MARSFRVLIVLALLAGCAQRTPTPIAAIPPSPAPVVAAIPIPAGASIDMKIPAVRADGSYPTPSDGLSRAAAVWHLRAALNVAALACRGPAGDAIAGRYNMLLKSHRTAFADAQTGVAADFRKVAATDWQDASDDAMTRLYNYYALAPARDGFCSAADRVLSALPGIAPAALADYAPQGLAELDRPFTDFFAAYDAWRTQSRGSSVAMISPVPTARRPAVPVLKIDPAIFR